MKCVLLVYIWPFKCKELGALGFEILSLFVFSGCDTGTAPTSVSSFLFESHKYMTSHLINNVLL